MTSASRSGSPPVLKRRRTRPAPRSKISDALPAARSLGSATLERQAALRPLAPRARIQAALAAREPGAVERDAGRHPRAAVGDELARGQLGKRLVPRPVQGAGDPAGGVVDLVRLAAPAARGARVHEEERRVGEAPHDLLRRDRVAAPLTRNELGRLDLLLAGEELAAPGLDPAEQDRALLVAEMAQQPPQTLGPAAVPVGHDEDAVADAGPPRRRREPLRRRQRMPTGVRNRE